MYASGGISFIDGKQYQSFSSNSRFSTFFTKILFSDTPETLKYQITFSESLFVFRILEFISSGCLLNKPPSAVELSFSFLQ